MLQDPNAITKYMHSEPVKGRLAEVIGERNVGPFIASVMMTVANDKTGKLQQCTPTSIYHAAMRAASLRLSCDPALGQAWLIPYKNIATFQPGYKGYYDMAVRTNRYRYINVSPRYEGETTEADPISGLITLKGLGGKRESDKIIGWLAAFELYSGYAKTIYMTVEEIHAYAREYSPSYDYSDSPWQSKKPDTVRAMEKKTVLRILLHKWGYVDPNDVAILEQVEQENETIEAEAKLMPEEEPIQEEPKDEAQLMAELGFPPESTPDETRAKVSDHDWNRWLALCNRAEKSDIDIEVGARHEYTPASLARIYAEKLQVVKKAEETNKQKGAQA